MRKAPRLGKTVFEIFAVIMLCTPALAQDYMQDYAPDIAELNGENGFAFAASERLGLATGGTIEFWVAPGWLEDPGFDPVILSNAGEKGASYLLALLRDRDGIAILSGDREEVAAFDFSDGRMHHVAVVYADSELAVLVDGSPIALLEMHLDDLPSSGFWVGTADGETAPFMGAIADLRVWSVPLSREDIVNFAQRNLFAEQQPAHPALGFLSAKSDFESGELFLSDK